MISNADGRALRSIGENVNCSFQIYLPGDFIIRQGSIGNRMFFIQKGTVSVLQGTRHLKSLSSGEYFGGRGPTAQ